MKTLFSTLLSHLIAHGISVVLLPIMVSGLLVFINIKTIGPKCGMHRNGWIKSTGMLKEQHICVQTSVRTFWQNLLKTHQKERGEEFRTMFQPEKGKKTLKIWGLTGSQIWS